MSQTLPGAACVPSPADRCSLCGDEGLPGLVVSVDARLQTAVVQMAGVPETVALDLLDGVEPGHTVLVHQGFAIGRMEPS